MKYFSFNLHEASVDILGELSPQCLRRENPMKKSIQPFETDLSYLTAEAEFIKARCTRQYIQIRLRDLNSPEAQLDSKTIVGESRKVMEDNLSLHLEKATKTEKAIRNTIDSRLSATRSVYGDAHLGIQSLESQHCLNGDERLTLTVLAIGGVSPVTLNDAVAVMGHLSPLSTEDILAIVIKPTSLEAWASGRDMFQRLVKLGLISLDYVWSTNWPEAIMSASPRLTSKTFACVTGIDGACDGDAESEAGHP
jgi:hypothetical protein